MLEKPRIIAIVGPTSSGKTSLAIEIAKQVNGEIISADSRQIYRGLDIGAGKVTKTEMRGIPHHLLDVANPKRAMSVVQYERLATRAVQDILKRGKVPILCGGTGLYIDAVLTKQSFPSVPPDAKLRHRLARLSTKELFEKLKKLDLVRAQNIDAKNPHRLIRAIEIATALGSVPVRASTESPYDTLIVGLTLPREELQNRIHIRLTARMHRGMVAEAERLHANRLSWKRMEELGLDYRALAHFLQNKITKQEMIRVIEKENWLYAKRQMVWFKRNKNIQWFKPQEITTILRVVKDYLK